ncbi:hypothetical protein BGW38_004396, partial [Lunasporangiospora selenospora]
NPTMNTAASHGDKTKSPMSKPSPRLDSYLPRPGSLFRSPIQKSLQQQPLTLSMSYDTFFPDDQITDSDPLGPSAPYGHGGPMEFEDSRYNDERFDYQQDYEYDPTPLPLPTSMYQEKQSGQSVSNDTSKLYSDFEHIHGLFSPRLHARPTFQEGEERDKDRYRALRLAHNTTKDKDMDKVQDEDKREEAEDNENNSDEEEDDDEQATSDTTITSTLHDLAHC